MELGKRPVDFRALVQKNGTGKWGLPPLSLVPLGAIISSPI